MARGTEFITAHSLQATSGGGGWPMSVCRYPRALFNAEKAEICAEATFAIRSLDAHTRTCVRGNVLPPWQIYGSAGQD